VIRFCDICKSAIDVGQYLYLEYKYTYIKTLSSDIPRMNISTSVHHHRHHPSIHPPTVLCRRRHSHIHHLHNIVVVVIHTYTTYTTLSSSSFTHSQHIHHLHNIVVVTNHANTSYASCVPAINYGCLSCQNVDSATSAFGCGLWTIENTVFLVLVI
jgi:hypothetical protein